MAGKKQLSTAETKALLLSLENRFKQHPHRHPALKWVDIAAKLVAQPTKLCSLQQMENTGGEPDVVGIDEQSGEYLFYDCSAETPKGRRSICYDDAALDARKEFKPASSALRMAQEMGVELLDEAAYRALHLLETVDTKTSSWIKTPDAVRKLGGALFADHRYGQVFIYHNGASSYYASRAFRAMLKV